jgi:flagellar biosynthesis protein FlhG
VAPRESVRKIVESAMDTKNAHGIRSPLDLLARVEREDPDAVPALKREIAAFHPCFVVNQVRDDADMAVGHQLVAACARHLGVRATFAGCVHFDDAVWRSVRRRKLFMVDAPDSRAAEEVRRLARGLVRGESLKLPW